MVAPLSSKGALARPATYALPVASLANTDRAVRAVGSEWLQTIDPPGFMRWTTVALASPLRLQRATTTSPPGAFATSSTPSGSPLPIAELHESGGAGPLTSAGGGIG